MGATNNDLEVLENGLGFKLPNSIKQSLRIHNGQDDPTTFYGLFNYNLFLSTQDILKDWKMMKWLFPDEERIEWLKAGKIQNQIWNHKWIKFSDSEGAGFVINLAPGPHGEIGQVFYRPNCGNPRGVLASSYESFLEAVTTQMLQNKFDIDEGMVVLLDMY